MKIVGIMIEYSEKLVRYRSWPKVQEKNGEVDLPNRNRLLGLRGALEARRSKEVRDLIETWRLLASSPSRVDMHMFICIATIDIALSRSHLEPKR